LNWTTTTVPLWQIDCDNFRKVGRAFELRDVTGDEHGRFVEVFAARYDLAYERKGTTVVFGLQKATSLPGMRPSESK
jgi:hypothetical protein